MPTATGHFVPIDSKNEVGWGSILNRSPVVARATRRVVGGAQIAQVPGAPLIHPPRAHAAAPRAAGGKFLQLGGVSGRVEH